MSKLNGGTAEDFNNIAARELFGEDFSKLKGSDTAAL